MSYYMLEYAHQLEFIDPADYAILKSWKTPQPLNQWRDLSLRRIDDSPLADATGAHSMLIVRLEVWEALEIVIGSAVETLPVDIAGDSAYALHVLQVVDCLDRDESIFRRFKNRVIGVEHYVLRQQALNGQALFVIAEDGYSRIFVSDKVKQVFEGYHFTGLVFVPVAIQGA